jgi:lysozyme family protein
VTDSNFAASLKRVLVHEGGYSNDKADPGGATMWGITHIDYDAYRKRKGLATQSVRAMTTTERDDIYRNKYWVGARCGELPDGVDYVVFDGAVNSGVAQSAKWLQRALGVTADGHIGDITLQAADEAHPDSLIHSMCDQRRTFLRNLKTFKTFGKGWMRRVDEVESTAVGMVHPDAPAEVLGNTDISAKARRADIAEPAVDQATATSGTVAAGGASALVQQIQTTLAPYSDTLTAIKYALIAVTLIGLCFTVYAMIRAKRLKEV